MPESSAEPITPGWWHHAIVRLGAKAWCAVGLALVAGLVLALASAVSSVVLPLVLAAVLAVVFRPSVAWLERRGLPSAPAALAVVLAVVVAVVGAAVLAVRGIFDQVGRLGAQLGPALDEVGAGAAEDELRATIEQMQPLVGQGFARLVVGGLSGLAGFATAAVLGSLIMYYLLKDGPSLRRWMEDSVAADRRPATVGFLHDVVRVLRAYARGRTVLSGIVALAVAVAGVLLGLPLVLTLALVNFVGGYVPYVGAVVGGGLAVVVALAHSGATGAMAMLVVVLGSNLVLENVVEPKVMGRTLQIHPLFVLLLTALGGAAGGLVGLVLAVPLALIAGRAVVRFGSPAFTRSMAGRATATLEELLPGGVTERRSPGAADQP